MTSLNDIIKQAMEFVLSGDTEILKILRNQYYKSIITNIEKSSVGCFTEFKIIGEIQKINPQNAYIGDVYLESEQLESRMGIILFIENGIISMLEFYTYGDDILPNGFESYKFVYENGKRDFNSYLS